MTEKDTSILVADLLVTAVAVVRAFDKGTALAPSMEQLRAAINRLAQGTKPQEKDEESPCR